MSFNFATWYYTVGDSSPGVNVWEMSTGGFVAVGAAGFGTFLSNQDPDAQIGGGFLGSANNGAGLIRVNCGSTSNFTTNMKVYYKGVQSAVSAAFAITVIDSTHFDLQGSTFSTPDTSAFIYGAKFIDTAANLYAEIDRQNYQIQPAGYLAVTSGVNFQMLNTPPLLFDFTPTVGGLILTVPQMNLFGSLAKGRLLLVKNSGSFAFTIQLFGALAVNPGIVPLNGIVALILTDNSTKAGLISPEFWLQARYETHGNANATLVAAAAAIAVYANSAALSAPRTWTLPAANTFIPGQLILVVDEHGGVSSTNTLSVARAGSDTINGAATSIVLNRAFDFTLLETDGASQFTIVGGKGASASTDLSDLPIPAASGGTGAATAAANTFFGGPTSGGAVAGAFRAIDVTDLAAATGAMTSWTPTVTAQTPGATPPTFTTNSAKYQQIDKIVLARFDITVTAAGTGAGYVQVTLPVNALSTAPFGGGGFGFNTGKMIGFGGSGPISNTSGRLFYYDASSAIVTGERLVIDFWYEAA